MGPRLPRTLRPGAVLAYANPERALAELVPRSLPPRVHVRAVQRVGRRVLEYGCGTGRITLALARAGMSVTGVDRSAAMLDRLSAQLGRERREVRGRVEIIHGDMRDLVVGERFPVVLVADGTFQHLYDREDVRAFLARVREHLTPGGLARLDVALPDLRVLSDPGPDAEYRTLEQVLIRALDGDRSALLAERQYFPTELRGLLERAEARLRSMRVVRPPATPGRAESDAPRVARLVVHCSWDARRSRPPQRRPSPC